MSRKLRSNKRVGKTEEQLGIPKRKSTKPKLYNLPATDTDLWGLYSCLMHADMSGYNKENEEWSDAMKKRISELRDLISGVNYQ